MWKEARSVDDKARSRRPDHDKSGLDREHRDSPTRSAVAPQQARAEEATQQQHRPGWVVRTARVGGKTMVALVSVVVLALTGYAWTYLGQISNVTTVDVLGDEAGGPEPLDGSRDILLVGMDSRTDAEGNPLPEHIMNDVLHVGGDGDTENTDTIILLHIPQDTEETVAMSIPRDSYVTIPGFGQHKINSAYPRAKLDEKQRLKDEGGHDKQELEVKSSEAGARKLVESVEHLTGHTIDNYASVNLLGFYEITKAIGGVDVCIKQDTEDSYTGLELSKGHHTVKGRKALSFVRQRHGLPHYGMDRIKRQQAFMAGIASKILSADMLTSPGKLNDLIDSIKDSIVLSKDWDMLKFAQRLRGLAGGDIKFYTVPIVRDDLPTPYDGAAVELDPQEVRKFIGGQTDDDDESGADQDEQSREEKQHNADITVNVFNTTDTSELAGRVADALTDEGFNEGVVSNAPPQPNTVVRHAADEEDNARQVAQELGENIRVSPDANLSPGEITVLIGEDYDPAQLPAGDGGAAGQSDPDDEDSDDGSAPTQSDSPADNSDADDSTDDDAMTADGIPCVY